jgi:hypothetical protein
MLDLQLHVQSVPIITKLVNSKPVHGKVYSLQHYVIKFVSDLRQIGGILLKVTPLDPPTLCRWQQCLENHYSHFVIKLKTEYTLHIKTGSRQCKDISTMIWYSRLQNVHSNTVRGGPFNSWDGGYVCKQISAAQFYTKTVFYIKNNFSFTRNT